MRKACKSCFASTLVMLADGLDEQGYNLCTRWLESETAGQRKWIVTCKRRDWLSSLSRCHVATTKRLNYVSSDANEAFEATCIVATTRRS
jgi:hypothetical protein